VLYGNGVYFGESDFYGRFRDFEFVFQSFNGGDVCGSSCAGCNDNEGINFPSKVGYFGN
jgi:hypothetical protein